MRDNIFLSTPSARRATWGRHLCLPEIVDFYPRPPRGGRQNRWHGFWFWWRISIHALREGGDEELTACIVRRDLFLSTPSARRATSD